MKRYNFDEIIPRDGTCNVKFDKRELLFGRADVIPLWVADMDFAAAPEIIEAIRTRTEHPILGYTYRSDRFFQSLIDWVERRNGWTIRREWIDFVPGVVPGLGFALWAFTEPGDKVVIQPPVYHPFAGQIRRNHREVVNNFVTCEGGRFGIDFEDLDRKLEGAKALMFCNPHNPVGRVYTPGELTRIGELCVKHDVLILSDEIHSDIVFKPHRHTHIAALSDEFAQRTLTFLAPSKTFNIAGLSTAVVVTPNESLRRRLNVEFEKLHADQGNIFGNVAFEAAYIHGAEWIDRMTEYVGANVDYVIDFLPRHIPGVTATRPEGTYLMWLDFSQWDMTHEDIFRFLTDKAGLGLNEGSMFGENGQGFMRMNVATQRPILEQAMHQLHKAYQEHIAKG